MGCPWIHERDAGKESEYRQVCLPGENPKIFKE